MNTRETVSKIIVEHLGVKPSEVTDDASFVDDLGADSLDLIELTMAMEEEFGITIDDSEMETIVTVSDAVNLVEGKVNRGA